MPVCFGLPVPEPGAGSGAGRAALLTVAAVVETQLLLEVERGVGTWGVFVADDVVGAGDHTTSTTGAQARVDDLLVEFFPLGGPAGLGRLGHLSNPTAAVAADGHRSGGR